LFLSTFSRSSPVQNIDLAGNYQEALSDAESGRELQPRYMKALETGASACVKLILYEKAIMWCDEGLAIDPENKTLQELRSISLKAKHSCIGKVENALETGILEDGKVWHLNKIESLW